MRWGCERLFLVPEGARGARGLPTCALRRAGHARDAGAREPRARCAVVGEELGTVPEGFRDALAAARVLSYRVLWFEREGDGFHDPPGLAGARRGLRLDA